MRRKILTGAVAVWFGLAAWSALPASAQHGGPKAGPKPATSAAPSAAPGAPKAPCKPGMVLVPAGSSTMGDAENTSRAGKVDVAAFCIDTTEVTTAAYAACVKSGKCKPTEPGEACNAGVAGREKHPINCVDWHRAKAYCEAQGARLPSEEEWEYAARGGDGRLFPWGNDEPGGQLCWSGAGKAEKAEARESTCAVATFPGGRSPFGVEDMAGNVAEWTSSASTSQNAWGEPEYIERGGAFNGLLAASVRAAYRDASWVPWEHRASLGFRCAGAPAP